MIDVKNVKKSYLGKTILNNITFSIDNSSKIGLIGKNGIGKSTLLKILNETETPDSGTIDRENSKFIGYLPQEIRLENDNSTVEEFIKKNVGLFEIEVKLNKYQKQLDSGNNDIIEEFCKVQDEYLELDGYDFDYKLDTILNGFNLDPNIKNNKISQLSGGQKTKILFASILLKGKDLIILDEPTNNLDLNSIKWLENYLKKLNIPLIIVSHDKKFLDKITNQTFEIDYETRELKTFSGSVSEYLKFKDEEYNNQVKLYEEQQRKVKSLKTAQAQQKNWAKSGRKQGVKDNDKFTRGYERNRSSKLDKKAKNIDKQIEQIQTIQKPKEITELKFNIKLDDLKGSTNINTNDLICGYLDKLSLPKINLNINLGDRLLIIGNNGIGKTTILKTILGDLSPLSGNVQIGTSLNFGYIPQDTRLNIDYTIEEYLLENLNNQIEKSLLYTVMNNFGFKFEDKDKVFQRLSPGERTRLLLLLFSLKKVNVLILDEPTNHLDLEAILSLENALDSFKGTIIATSHDRDFIERLNPNIILSLENNSIKLLNSFEKILD